MDCNNRGIKNKPEISMIIITKNRLKNIVIVIAITLLMISPVYALQQTTGALSINIKQDEQGFANYGLKNEENKTVTVKLSANGSIADYIDFPKELTIASGEFIYVNITTNLSSNYNGSRALNGTIYALKEGEKGGQVQLNIRLGKRINLNIAEPPATTQPSTQKNNLVFGGITLIGIVIMVAVVMRRKAKVKTKEQRYKLNIKEVENK